MDEKLSQAVKGVVGESLLGVMDAAQAPAFAAIFAYIELVNVLAEKGILSKAELIDRITPLPGKVPQDINSEMFRDILGLIQNGVEFGPEKV
jgi:hypothetical protein